MPLTIKSIEMRGRWLVMLCLVALCASCGGSGKSFGDSGNNPTDPANPPAPPTAQITTIDPGSPEAGDTVTFNGSGTGAGITFLWDFGDSTSAAGAQANHVYPAPGTYMATLTVTDNTGRQASASSPVSISATVAPPSAPNIVLITRTQPTPGIAVKLLASSVDPNGGSITYAWTFSDGGTAAGQRVDHIFSVAGTYTIQVTATNPQGASATAQTVITITDTGTTPPPPPIIPSMVGPILVRANASYSYSGSAVSISGAFPLTFIWNFGDSSAAESGQTVRHTYAAGTYRPVLTVTDSNGASAQMASQVTVLPPVPPHDIIIHGPQEVQLGDSAGFSATFENPENNPVTYQWNFGDGAVSAVPAPSHTYALPGQHTVSVVITDVVSGSATASMTLAVNEKSPIVDLPCASANGNGWCLAPALPGANTSLNAISFANAKTGWIVGENGSIYHSTDGGINWLLQPSAPAALIGVSAVDSNHAWTITRGGSVLRTVDGGATWSNMPSGVSFGLTAVKFADLQHGWVIGQSEGIAATTDGGQTWAIQNVNSSNPQLNAIDFADINHGWAVGDGGEILGTVDGGQIWETQFQTGSRISLKAVSFSDTQHGWVVGGGGLILQTIDGGKTWSSAASPTSSSINAVKFVDASHGWIVTEVGLIYFTADGGHTWQQQNTPTQTTGLPSMDAANANNAWIVSAGGKLLLTATGGQ